MHGVFPRCCVNELQGEQYPIRILMAQRSARVLEFAKTVRRPNSNQGNYCT